MNVYGFLIPLAGFIFGRKELSAMFLATADYSMQKVKG